MKAEFVLPEFPEKTPLLEKLAALAPAAVCEQLESGYDHPIRQSGGLMQSIRAEVTEEGVEVGSSLPYAARVHARYPFLTDGLTKAAEEWKESLMA